MAPREGTTPALRGYEPSVCRSTGMCAPSVEPVPVRVAADLKRLDQPGVSVERVNLAQHPGALTDNALVYELTGSDAVCRPTAEYTGRRSGEFHCYF